jgi:outer membrane protein assembly factor BamB
VRRFVPAFAALSWATAAALMGLPSCASSEPAPRAPDAAVEAGFVDDAQESGSDAGALPFEPCGDTRGLAQGAPWPMKGRCPKRSGYAASPAPRNATVRWTADFPATLGAPVVDAVGVVWVGTDEGALLALREGNVIGAVSLGGALGGAPALSAEGITILGGGDRDLYGVVADPAPADAGAVDAAGSEDAGLPPARIVFRVPLSPVRSSVAIAGDGTLLVGTASGKLVALGGEDQAVRWSVTTHDTGGSSPAIGEDGTVYVGSSDGMLYAVSAGGAVLWTYQAGAPLGDVAIGAGETILAGGADGTLHAVRRDGTVRWTHAIGGPITGIAAAPGVAYVASEDKRLHALAAEDGAERWTFETLGAVGAPAVGSDGAVCFGSADGRFYVVAPSGLLIFAVNARGAIRAAPALGADGTAYVGTSTGIVAIGP